MEAYVSATACIGEGGLAGAVACKVPAAAAALAGCREAAQLQVEEAACQVIDNNSEDFKRQS